MKSTALLLALILASFAAQAGTLADTLCGATPTVCKNVANRDGPSVDLLQYDWAHGRVLVTLGGELYDSGLYALPNGSMAFSVLTLTSANGGQILLSATFRTWSTVSGRTRLTHWELVSGSVTP